MRSKHYFNNYLSTDGSGRGAHAHLNYTPVHLHATRAIRCDYVVVTPHK